MPRKAREVFPNVPYHIIQRGNFKEKIFDNDDDKDYYLGLFNNYSIEFNLKVYAWCLMDNHVHFVVEPTDVKSLSKVFQMVSMMYSQYYNKKKGRKGKVWQDRFYSLELDNDHFYEAIRYVELNPLRAGMISAPFDYYWTSCFDRYSKEYKLVLTSVSDYFEVDDWTKYLLEKTNPKLIKYLKLEK